MRHTYKNLKSRWLPCAVMCLALLGSSSTFCIAGTNLSIANFTSVITPLYGSSNANSGNDRLPFMFRATVSGLAANTVHRYYIQATIPSDLGGTNSGAGNSVFAIPAAYGFTSGPSMTTLPNYDTFTTDASGNYTGWFGFVNTGNARFAPGNVIRPAITVGNTGGTVIHRFALDVTYTALQFSTNAGANNGSGIRATFTGSTAKNLVCLYDNTAGTGRPLACTPVESIGNALASIVSFYTTNVTGQANRFGTIIPNNNANGVRRFEERSLSTGAIVGCAPTDADGTWPTGSINTVNPTAGTTAIVVSSTDVTNVCGGPLPVTAIGSSNLCQTSATLSWTNPGTVYNILVFAKQGAAITAGTPTADASTYTADPDFGIGSSYENDGSAFLVYKGTSNTVDITGLGLGNTYHFLIYNLDNATYSTGTTANLTTTSAISPVTGLACTPGSSQITLNWTNSATCFDEVLVIAREGSAINTTPTGDGTAYVANSVFGTSGSDAGLLSSNEYAVYKSNGNSVVVTGLTNGNTYYFDVVVRKGLTWSLEASTNCSPSPLPPAINLTSSSTGGSIAQNSNSNIIYQVQVDVTNQAATLNSVVVTTGGTYQTTDIKTGNSFRLFYSPDASLDTLADTQLGVNAVVTSGSNITFGSLTQLIPVGTGYLFVVTNIRAAAVVGRTVKVGTTLANITFAAGSKSGTVTAVAASGTYTIVATPVVTLTALDPNGCPAGNNFTLGSTENIIYRTQVNPNIAVSLSGFNFTTLSTATYTATTIAAFKLYFSTDAVLDGLDTQLGGDLNDLPGSVLAFSGFSQPLAANTNYYLFVVADIASTLAAAGKTVGGKINFHKDLTFNLTVDSVKTITDGCLHTIVSPSVQFPNTAATKTEGSGSGNTTYNLNLQFFGALVASSTITIDLTGTATYGAGLDYTIGTPSTGTASVVGTTLTYTLPAVPPVTPAVITIPVLIVKDNIDEGSSETIVFTMTGTTGGTTINTNQNVFTLTVDDDDVPSVINFAKATDIQGEAGAPAVTVTLPISPAAAVAGNVTINVVNSGSVTYTTDYTTMPAVSAGTITVPVIVGASSISFQVSIVNDGTAETAQTITFTIAPTPGPATMVRGTAFTHVLTIVDGTLLEPGDFAIVAVNANRASCTAAPNGSGVDEISFVCFKDLLPGTAIDLTDNGYERTTAGYWGGTEGVLRIIRAAASATIPAGTVITIRVDNDVLNFVNPSTGWDAVVDLLPTYSFALNNGGDQIYFMQGGSWGGFSGASHVDTYTGGRILYGFTTSGSWNAFGSSTQKSGLYPGMDCFNAKPTSASDFNKYTGGFNAPTGYTKREWIRRLSNSGNWTNYATCDNFDGMGTNYVAGLTLVIPAGGFTDGIWEGGNANWFDCNNWQSLAVPDETTNVLIGASKPTYPNISTNVAPAPYISAEARDVTIATGGNLQLSSTGLLDVYGSFSAADATFLHASGTGSVNFIGSTPATISTDGFDITFRNLKTANSAGVSLLDSIVVASSLDLSSGTLFLNGQDLELAGSTVALTAGTLDGSAVNSSMTYTGTGSTIIPAVEMERLVLNRSGANDSLQMRGDVVLRGAGTSITALRYTDGDLALNENTLTIQDGTIVGNGGSIKGRSTGSNFAINSDVNIQGTGDAGTLRFLTGFQRIDDFTLNRSGATNRVRLGSALTVQKNITLDNGTMELNNNILTVKGIINGVSGATGYFVGGGTSAIVISQVNSSTASTSIPTVTSGLANLTMARFNGASLGDSLSVSTALTYSSGGSLLTTDLYNLNLGTTGTVSGETNGRYTIGYLKAFRTVLNDNNPVTFGNIGTTITNPVANANMGLTRVVRYAGPGTAVTDGVYSSIERQWNVSPITQPSGNASLKLDWLSDDQNGLSLTNMQAYKSIDNGTSWLEYGPVIPSAAGYTVTVSTPTFSKWTVGSEAEPFPVKLVSFTGRSADGIATLLWRTATENNCYGYEVQKSTDGQDFNKIGFVKSEGNTNTARQYQLPDYQFASSSYYRLKILDNDGKTAYSQSIYLQQQGKAVVSVYPNPSKGAYTISMTHTPANVTASVLTVDGKTLTAVQGSLETVNEQLNYLMMAQAQGVYILRLLADKEVFTIRLIKE